MVLQKDHIQCPEAEERYNISKDIHVLRDEINIGRNDLCPIEQVFTRKDDKIAQIKREYRDSPDTGKDQRLTMRRFVFGYCTERSPDHQGLTDTRERAIQTSALIEDAFLYVRNQPIVGVLLYRYGGR